MVFQVFLYPNSTVLTLNNHLGTSFKVLAVQELLLGLRLVMQWVILI
uniref:Uncharacterized protein n=1 Tax=Arundo donax TaxID=35708 RepID=A0A0A9BBF1_ARUDO